MRGREEKRERAARVYRVRDGATRENGRAWVVPGQRLIDGRGRLDERGDCAREQRYWARVAREPVRARTPQRGRQRIR